MYYFVYNVTVVTKSPRSFCVICPPQEFYFGSVINQNTNNASSSSNINPNVGRNLPNPTI